MAKFTNQLDSLAPFLPPTQNWFTQTLGQPTPPQAQGWPAIQRGENTLILAPTGSGKTLTAFLWGVDQIYHELTADDVPPDTIPKTQTGKRKKPKNATSVLYISPLKALNNDIDRNLRMPPGWHSPKRHGNGA